MDIIIQSSSERGRKFTIHGTEALIGRGAHCDVCLRDERLSGQHAKLHYKNGSWYVFDLGSRNGTWVNRQRLYQERRLQPSDEVGVGKTVLRFENFGMARVAAMPAPVYDANSLAYAESPSVRAEQPPSASGKMPVWPLFLLLLMGLFMLGGIAIFATSLPYSWVEIGAILGILLMLPWGTMGVFGGINMTIKKFKGSSWDMWWLLLFLFGLIPIGLWFVFLAFTSLFGVWAWNGAISMLPSKRRCMQCKGWNDYDAVRCTHCGQSLT